MYTLFLLLYALLARVVAPFNLKARLFVRGRRGQFHRLQRELLDKRGGKSIVWVHCASTGEFEQGRPLIEAIKQQRPGVQVMLTFFSPSGYEACKRYAGADYVFYLPLDFWWNARRFVHLVQPSLAVFVKYEYWRNYLTMLNAAGVEVMLVSAIFRPGQVFFRPVVGRFFKAMLRSFSTIFVQNMASLHLLHEAGFRKVLVSGDTRFDRVVAIAAQPKHLPALERFALGQEVLIAGSTWDKDEELLLQVAAHNPQLRMIIVPHEIHSERIERLLLQLPQPGVRYSQLLTLDAAQAARYRYVVVDSVGILSSVYKLGRYAYIGGGFGVGIHNVLEAAVFGVPLFFGKNYHKFKEATDLIALGGAFSVANAQELQQQLHQFQAQPDLLANSGEACKQYVQQNTGATQRIMQHLLLNN